MTSILNTLKVINQMLADGVVNNYAIGGAIAASFYVEASATEDIDIFVHIEPEPPRFLELNGIYAYLDEKGYYPKDEFVVIEGWDVQFLIPAIESIEKEAVEQASIIRFYDEEVRVIIPEYLVAIMLATGREKDTVRAVKFIKEDQVNIDELQILIDRFGLEEQWQKTLKQLEGEQPTR